MLDDDASTPRVKLELSQEELQERIDRRLVKHAIWFCPISSAYFLFCAVQARMNSELYDIPPSLVLPEVLFHLTVGISFLVAGIAASRVTIPSPYPRRIAAVFLTVMHINALVLLYASLNSWIVGSIALVMGFSGFFLTTLAPYLVINGLTILIALPMIPYSSPHEVYENQVALAIGFVMGYMVLVGRRKGHSREDQLEWQKERRNEELRLTIGRLKQEIQQRKSLEADLRASEKQYRSIFENSLVGVFQCDLEGRFLLANQRIAAMLGYASTADLMRFSLVENLTAVAGSTSPPTMEMLFAQMTEQGVEATSRLIDGQPRTIQVHLREMHDDIGRSTGYEGLMLDVTQRKAAEEAIRIQREQIMHVSRLATMGEMLAGIAHEVNQPLYAIANFASASLRAMPRSDDESWARIRHWNDSIAREAARAGEIIKRIRSLVQKAKPELRTIEVPALIRDTLKMSEPLLRQCHVTTRVLVEEDVAPVRADLILVQQVLINLIRNACDAMHSDEGDPKLLTARARNIDNFVEISIEDSGPGLLNEAGKDIFQAFVSTKPGGMGLGLAISRSIIEAHSGHIWVDSKPGHGTTISLTLPQYESSTYHATR